MEKVVKKKNYNLSLSNRRRLITGIIISKNKNITCIIRNPVDYLVDGLTFINNHKIENIFLNKIILKEEIINSKFIIQADKDERFLNYKFDNFKDFFNQLKKINAFCELSLKKENVIYIGKVINVNDKSVDVDFYDVNFKLMDNAYIEFEDITLVNIFTDYADTFGNVVSKRYF